MSSCNGAGAQIGPEAEYQTVPENVREPSVSTQAEYDVVPDKSDRPPPPLPGPRLVTDNPVYETKGNTFSHPATLKHRQDPPYSKDAADSEPDYKEGDTWRKCILISLSILVVVGLLMAVASVCLVLVMWFGAYVPGCPRIAESTTENNCTCSSIELQKLMNETQALLEQLKQLNSSFDNFTNSSSTSFDDLSKRAKSLSMSVMDINSSCIDTLDEVRNSPVSLENTTFRANLTNANIFGSCLYEYLSNCTMNTSTDSCETAAAPINANGYYNLEQTCHVAIQLGNGAARFAPVNNLVIVNDTMKCSCVAVRIHPVGDRTATFTCFLFRARCPVSSDFGVPVIKET